MAKKNGYQKKDLPRLYPYENILQTGFERFYLVIDESRSLVMDALPLESTDQHSTENTDLNDSNKKQKKISIAIISDLQDDEDKLTPSDENFIAKLNQNKK